MKTTIRINAVTEEIIMSKATAAKAKYIGTEEYKQLARAKKDFPNFTVKISSPKYNPKAKSNKRLNMMLMDRLVEVMSSGSQKAITDFAKVKQDFKGTEYHFTKPKAYFLLQYPNWNEWLSQVEEQQEEQAEAEPAAADLNVTTIMTAEEARANGVKLEF